MTKSKGTAHRAPAQRQQTAPPAQGSAAVGARFSANVQSLEEFVDRFTLSQDKLPQYLSKLSYEELRHVIETIERTNPNKYITRYLLRGCEFYYFQYLSYEIVTRELCSCILEILRRLVLRNAALPEGDPTKVPIGPVEELGAGFALLTAVLNCRLTEMPKLRDAIGGPILASEPFDNVNSWYASYRGRFPVRGVFGHVAEKSFKDFAERECGGSVAIVAWPHAMCELELRRVFSCKRVRHVIIVGEPVGWACLTKEFAATVMAADGYRMTRIPALTICQVDFFYEDTVRRPLSPRMCRSEVILFSRDVEWTEAEVREMFGKWIGRLRELLPGEAELYKSYESRFMLPEEAHAKEQAELSKKKEAQAAKEAEAAKRKGEGRTGGEAPQPQPLSR